MLITRFSMCTYRLVEGMVLHVLHEQKYYLDFSCKNFVRDFVLFFRNRATKVRSAKIELAEKVCDTVGRLFSLTDPSPNSCYFH